MKYFGNIAVFFHFWTNVLSSKDIAAYLLLPYKIRMQGGQLPHNIVQIHVAVWLWSQDYNLRKWTIVFCLSSHSLCIMFMNCPYERGIILHHDHYLTIIIQMPISQIWLWKLYLHVASLIFKMLHNFYRHWNMLSTCHLYLA